MPIFTYSAYTSAGDRVNGEIEAISPRAAEDALMQRGLLVYRTSLQAAAGANLLAGLARAHYATLSLTDYALFARQLATLLQAELPVDQALQLVQSQAGGSRIGIFAGRLATAVVAGRSLSDAFAKEAERAPLFIAPLIRAGEARGSLTSCLVDLARILERRVEVRDRLRGALLYPALLLGLAVLTVTLVVGVLVPTLLPLFQDSGAEPPLALQLADDLGRLVSNSWPLLLSLGLLLPLAALVVLRRASAKVVMDRVLLRLPLFGDLTRQTNVALLTRTLGSLVRNGVPLASALSLTATAASNGAYRQALEVSSQALKEGSKLTVALERTGVFPDLALRFVGIGEETSRLDDMLLHVADITDGETQRRVDRLLTILTPAITLFVGIFIGGLILSVMQAVLSVNDLATQ